MARNSNKLLIKQWISYNEALKNSSVTIPEMEALRPFMGARGGVLKRQTRSKKQKAAFNNAKQAIKEKHGTKYSAEHWKQEQKKAKTAKQKKTAGQNAAIKRARKQHKKKPDFNKPLSKAAQKTIEEAEQKYSRMIDILDKGAKGVLSTKVQYEIYKILDEQNVSDDDIEEFITKLLETLEDIPEEAKLLSSQDDFYSTLATIRDMNVEDKENLQAMFVALVNNPDDRDGVLSSIDYFQENNDIGMGYEQFYNRLMEYNDPWNTDNYMEVLEDGEN